MKKNSKLALKAKLTFQARVSLWVEHCFGPSLAADPKERALRFLEEAVELVQACGLSEASARNIVNYCYVRPAGEIGQEIGGVMLTLHALAEYRGYDVDEQGESELERAWAKVELIREKQKAKERAGVGRAR